MSANLEENEDSGTPSEVSSAEDVEMTGLLPEKSKKMYNKKYKKFVKWCSQRNITDYDEEVLLSFFSEESTKFKCSTLWSHYSMLKSTLMIKKGIDISRFPKLIAYLKIKNYGYTPEKSRLFTREEISKFMLTAPNKRYLLMKVILMMGIAGKCRREEFASINVDDIQDLGSVLIVNIPHTKRCEQRKFTIIDNASLNLLQLFRKYAALRPACDHNRFFINYTLGKCTKQPLGVNSIGRIPKLIATYLKLPHFTSYTGHSLRRSSPSLLMEQGPHTAWKPAAVAEGYVTNSAQNQMQIQNNFLEAINKPEETQMVLLPSGIHPSSSAPCASKKLSFSPTGINISNGLITVKEEMEETSGDEIKSEIESILLEAIPHNYENEEEMYPEEHPSEQKGNNSSSPSASTSNEVPHVHKQIKNTSLPNSNVATKKENAQKGQTCQMMPTTCNRRDNCDIFGELVAGKMRHLKTDYARHAVENMISNVLWDASMGKYDFPPESSILG